MDIKERNLLFARADKLASLELPKLAEGLRQFYEMTRKHDWVGAEKLMTELEDSAESTVFAFLRSKGESSSSIMQCARQGKLKADGKPVRDPRKVHDFEEVVMHNSNRPKVYKAS